MDIFPILSTLRKHKVTAILLILEIALTCAIVCNAAFLVALRLDRMHTPSGVREDELAIVSLSDIGTQGDVQARALEDVAALRQLPGVSAVSIMNQVPFGSSGSVSSVNLTQDQKAPSAIVGLYYGERAAETLGLELTRGRWFEPGEYHWVKDVVAGVPGAAPTSAIITETLAARLFPGADPLGKTILVDGPARVVGVVRHFAPSQVWPDSDRDMSVLMPVRMSAGAGLGTFFVLRTEPGHREQVMANAIARLRAIDPHRVVRLKMTFDQERATYFATDIATTGWLIATCGALLVITALGIVGLGSFWVAQRRRQIGVRRALGARRVDILRYFQTENFLLATLGIVLGGVLAYGVSFFLVIHDELPRLPADYLVVGAIVLWALGQAAVLSPALRAASVPPVEATRA